MVFLKTVIKESDVADDAKVVGEDAELVGIAEMPVDVHLLCIRAGGGL